MDLQALLVRRAKLARRAQQDHRVFRARALRDQLARLVMLLQFPAPQALRVRQGMPRPCRGLLGLQVVLDQRGLQGQLGRPRRLLGRLVLPALPVLQVHKERKVLQVQLDRLVQPVLLVQPAPLVRLVRQDLQALLARQDQRALLALQDLLGLPDPPAQLARLVPLQL